LVVEEAEHAAHLAKIRCVLMGMMIDSNNFEEKKEDRRNMYHAASYIDREMSGLRAELR
jgi:hypothetical protein